MKQLLAAILAVVVIATIGCTSVFAEAPLMIVPPEGAAVEVSYTVSGGYTVIVPDSIMFGEETTVAAEVKIENAKLEFGKRLVLSVSSANTYKLKLDGSDVMLPYYVRLDSTNVILSGTKQMPILSAIPGGGDVSETMRFIVTKPGEAAGKYKDTLTFLVSVE